MGTVCVFLPCASAGMPQGCHLAELRRRAVRVGAPFLHLHTHTHTHTQPAPLSGKRCCGCLPSGCVCVAHVLSLLLWSRKTLFGVPPPLSTYLPLLRYYSPSMLTCPHRRPSHPLCHHSSLLLCFLLSLGFLQRTTFSSTMLRRSPALRLPRNMTMQDPICKQALDHCTPIVYSSLPNGFRVATEYVKDCPFATIGVWIDAGSRFEDIHNSGVAHFLEHMNFKGTDKYSKRDVENLFEHRGAHFNAYTSRDRTAYYVKAFNKDVDKMMDVVSDLLQNGRYRRHDIEMERPTILAEMREVEELVDEVIMDNIHQAAYDPTTSGLPLTILGPVDNIAKNINKAMIEDYVRVHYTGPRMCLVSSGGLSPEQTHQLAQKYFSALPATNNRPRLHGVYKGGYTVLWNEIMATANTAVAFPICGASHPDSYPLQLIHNVIGQFREGQFDQFSAQRRNPNLPWEKVPNLVQMRPFYTPYEETALLGYNLVTARTSTSNNRSDEGFARDDAQTVMLNYILSSLYDLCATRVDADLLEAAKAEFKASVMMMRDSTTNSAEDLGRQMIHFGRRVPLQEVFEHVDAVTPESLRAVAGKYFSAVQPTVSSIGASSTLPKYDPLSLVSAVVRPQLTPAQFPAEARACPL